MEGPMILAHPNIPSSEGVFLQPIQWAEVMQRRAYDRNQINHVLRRLDYHSLHRALGNGSVWSHNGNCRMEWAGV